MLALSDPAVRYQSIAADWAPIHDREVPLLIAERAPPLPPDMLLALELPDLRATISCDRLETVLAHLPLALAVDLTTVARRFAALMQVDAVTLRLERVGTDSCRRFHADYADVRLVTTYAGPGTDHHETTDPASPVQRMPTGAVGLFKGRLFPGNPPVILHRSPPIEGRGAARLVLVIDTPARA